MKDQVYGVGYRRLPEGRSARWAPWPIARTALTLAWRKRSTKLGVGLCGLSVFGHGMALAAQVLAERFIDTGMGGASRAAETVVHGVIGDVHTTLANFIGVQMIATAFLLAMVAAGLIAEDRRTGAMELYFEGAGKAEDRALIDYMRDLKARGHDFDKDTAAGYDGLSPDDFKRLCLGKPLRRTKATPMIQIADLVLYPMAKAGYVADYPPYVKLKAAGKLIDAHLPADALATRGIKYSCFDAADTTKAQPYG